MAFSGQHYFFDIWFLPHTLPWPENCIEIKKNRKESGSVDVAVCMFILNQDPGPLWVSFPVCYSHSRPAPRENMGTATQIINVV